MAASKDQPGLKTKHVSPPIGVLRPGRRTITVPGTPLLAGLLELCSPGDQLRSHRQATEVRVRPTLLPSEVPGREAIGREDEFGTCDGPVPWSCKALH